MALSCGGFSRRLSQRDISRSPGRDLESTRSGNAASVHEPTLVTSGRDVIGGETAAR